jgi:diketogulonate reductase-like aldo/keto reductase
MILQKNIPSTGEIIPAIGLGTWQIQRQPLSDIFVKMLEMGSTVVDTSPMYGQSENFIGEASSHSSVNDKLFIATKVWTTGEAAGIKQMNRSFDLLNRKTIDLMQIHNLTDWQTQIKTLRKWKEEGRIRYTGLTHYTNSAHSTLTKIIKDNPVDFVQINYNIVDWDAEKELFPMALEKKVAIIANRPFETASLFQRVAGKPLPEWTEEFDCKNWTQFFLKFILSHPAVTCAIPATSNINHLIDNIEGAAGTLPNEAQRNKMKLAIQ